MLNPSSRLVNPLQPGWRLRWRGFLHSSQEPKPRGVHTDGHRYLGRVLTAAVIASFRNCPDDRLTVVLAGAVRHLHGFIREIEPTQNEWDHAIDFLTAVGRMSNGPRQAFVLLSDVLGASTLVDSVNNRNPAGATESTVLGPFHVSDSPARKRGADIALIGHSPRCVVRGTVRSVDGHPLPGAAVAGCRITGLGLECTRRPMGRGL